MIQVSVSFLQGVFLILLSPLVAGLEHYFVAWFQGRRRSLRYLFQAYVDLLKLLRIEPIRPRRASWFFGLAPGFLWAITVLLAFTVTMGWAAPFLVIDMIVLAYLLGLFRFTLSLAGLDGSMSFGGLGGAREMFLNFIVEINFFLFLAVLALRWQHEVAPLQLPTLFRAHAALGWHLFTSPELVILPVVLGILILYEIERIPVGQPATHLELTMSEKAITLSWRGRDLAWVKAAGMIKVTFLLTLFIDLFMPGAWPLSTFGAGNAWMTAPLFLSKLLLVIIGLSFLTATRAKLRLTKQSSIAFFAGALSLLSIVYLITIQLYKGT